MHFGHTQYLPIALPLFALLAGALALLLILVQIRVLRYAYTVLLDAANAIRNTAPRVLLLLCLRERFGIWVFDADEDNKEIRILHHLQKLRSHRRDQEMPRSRACKESHASSAIR